MGDRIRLAVAGLGKMGLSHFALARAHPDADTVGCDSQGFMLDVLDRYVPTTFYRDYAAMLETAALDAVLIATPSRLHPGMVRAALERGLHVFCEKPFCLDWRESLALAELAEAKGVVNQVGYHYRFVGAFRRVKQILEAGALGQITHVLAEAYGPVVLRPRRQTWRTKKEEGGGSLYDYAAHPLNLLNWFFGAPERVSGSVLAGVFSQDTDDQVMSTLGFPGGVTAQLSVNWSDESHRKMTTKITMIGTNGRLQADRQECQLYLRAPVPGLPEAVKGWNVQYTTELTEEPWFYLRGEEYSAQIEAFIAAVRDRQGRAVGNGFRAAAETDRTIAMILEDSAGLASPRPAAASPAPRRRGWFGRG